MIHALIHWLDDLRHEGISTLSWESVKTNLGAWPWQAAMAVVLIKVFRDKFVAWLHKVTRHLIAPHLEAHLEEVKRHVTTELERVAK